MSRAKAVGALTIALVTALGGCDSGPSQTEQRAVTVKHLASDFALAHYREFATRMDALDTAVGALCAAPDQALLDAARDAALAADVPWKQAEVIQFGPVVEYPERLGPKIDDWPVKTADLETLLVSEEPLTVESFASRGTAVRGIPVVEYLLWGPSLTEDDTLASLSGRRCEALVGVTGDLHANADALVAAWESPWVDWAGAPSLADEGPWDFPQQALDEWTNRLAFTVENIRVEKLGKPVGDASGGEPQPDTIERRYSGASLAAAKHALAGVEQVWTGLDGSPESGIRSLVQSEALAASIDDQLADAMAKLDAIPEPLESAVTEDPGAIVAAQDALQALQVSIQVDLAQDLSVTITFNDNDGD